MDLQPHTQPEFTLVSMTNSRLGSAQYVSLAGSSDESNIAMVCISWRLRRCSGGFFPGAAGFTVDGGIFTSNITNNVYNPLLEEQPSGTSCLSLFFLILTGHNQHFGRFYWVISS